MYVRLSTLAVMLALTLSASAKPKNQKAAVATSNVPASSVPSSSVPSSSAASSAAASSAASPAANSAASSAAAPQSSVSVVLPPTGSIPPGPIATDPAGTPPPCPNGCTWPTWDAPPPILPEWENLIDMSKVPNVPIIGSTVPGSASGEPINPGYTAANDPYCTWQFTQCTRPSDIIDCPKGSWGLTYDDGPSPYSPFLETLLDQNQQKATRFVIGSRALEYPQALQAMCDAGHQVAIHTFSHPYLTTMNTTTVIAELKWTELIIKTICGVTPRYFRPPHGDVDDRIRYIATALGYKTVIWNRDSGDWQVPVNPGPNDFQPSWVSGNVTIWANSLATSTDGILSLEHELSQAEAGESVICYPIIQKGGWKIQTVADCQGDPWWYLEQVNKTANTTSTAVVTATGATGAPAANGSAAATGGPSSTTPHKSTAAHVMGISIAAGFLSVFTALVL